MSKKQIISLFLTLIILPQIITEEDFYTLLGVSRQATQKEIKKAFRTLSLKYHPDRNPNDKKAHDLYLRINKAHEVLTDPDKKRIYDIYGEEGLNKESELMREDLEKGPDARADITVSLEDLYNGSSRRIEMEKNIVCPDCHGTGGKLGKTKQCPHCNGRGVSFQTVNMMGMTMQMQQTCPHCNGKGIIFSEVCPHCHGRKVVRQKKGIDIEIEKGMKDGQEIVFHRESEQSPGTIPGDLIVKLIQKKHNFFNKRIDDDLYADIEINLKEALLGYNKKITHLDRREFYIQSHDVTQPFHVRKIDNEGMPVHKFPSQKGDLYLQFIVKLPKSLTQDEKNLIQEIFKD